MVLVVCLRSGVSWFPWRIGRIDSGVVAGGGFGDGREGGRVGEWMVGCRVVWESREP